MQFIYKKVILAFLGNYTTLHMQFIDYLDNKVEMIGHSKSKEV